jgi:uncharacterized protein (DUF1778 family)
MPVHKPIIAGFFATRSDRQQRKFLMETTQIQMSQAGFEAFLEILSRPARPVPEMVELFRRASLWEKDARAKK